MIPFISVEEVHVVPVVPCLSCGVDMPADHECLSPDLAALIRAAQDDYIRYGSPSDMDGGAR